VSDRNLILDALRDIPDGTGSRETVAEVLAERFVVINRDELPIATTDGKYVRVEGDIEAPVDGRVSSETLRERACSILAAAEYLRENPPVDERAVDDLHDALAAHSMGLASISSETARRVARRLIADGWTKP
jgi:hypothetical protein